MSMIPFLQIFILTCKSAVSSDTIAGSTRSPRRYAFPHPGRNVSEAVFDCHREQPARKESGV